MVFSTNLIAQAPTLKWNQEYTTPAHLTCIWGTAEDDIFIGGGEAPNEFIAHFDGASWEVQVLGDFGMHAIREIWGTSSSNVYATGGQPAKILHYDGNSWTEDFTGPNNGFSESFWGIWGSASDNIYVTTKNTTTGIGKIYRYDGVEWQLDFSDDNFESIWGADPNNIWAVSEVNSTARIHYFDGNNWSLQSQIPGFHVQDMKGLSASDVYAVGQSGTTGEIYHFDGNLWSSVLTLPGSGSLRSVWTFAVDDVLVSGSNGMTHRYNGTDWSQQEVSVMEDLGSIFALSNESVWIAGKNFVPQVGFVAHGTPATIQDQLDDGTPICDLILTGVPIEDFYGLNYEGGIIFHLDPCSGFGLVANEQDLGDLESWGCLTTDTPAPNVPQPPNGQPNINISGLGAEIGDGVTNAQLIIDAGCSNDDDAVSRCNTYVSGSFDDWFLPSVKELRAMYTNLHLNGHGGFVVLENVQSGYWSSSEFNFELAWDVAFRSGNPGATQKDDAFGTQVGKRVRPVRSFQFCSLGVSYDEIAPSITCPDGSATSFTLPADPNGNAILPDYSNEAIVRDNCSSQVSIQQDPPPGSILNGFGTTHLVTLTAIDDNGNSSSCSFTVGVGTLQSLEELLNSGVTVCELLASGVHPDDFHGINYQGGLIYHIDPCAGYGLIVAPNDLGNLESWGCVGTDTEAPNAPIPLPGGPYVPSGPGAEIGDGLSNTLQILSGNCSNSTSPANRCFNHNDGLYDDWFLPSAREMRAMYINLWKFDGLGGFATPASGTSDYWTSTEHNASEAWDVSFGSGNPGASSKSNGKHIRPTRRFGFLSCSSLDVNCPEDITVHTDPGSCTALVTFADPVFIDNCGVDNVVCEPASGSVFPKGTTTVTCTATDIHGNESECMFDITVEDDEDPVIECPDGTGLSFTLVADSDCNAVLPDYTVETSATDNCSESSGITITQIPIGGTILSGHGTSQEVTMRAEDASGRISECTFTVTVEDQTDPVIECPDGIGLSFTLVADSDCNAVLPDYTVETSATDNCSASSGITITQIPVGGTVLSGHGTSQEVTMRAEDASGRISECTFIVTVEDQTDPVIECPDGTGLLFTLVADSDCNAVLPDYTVETSATDNCSASSGITITQIPVGGTVLSGHGTSQEVTMRAEDASGRISECTFRVTVEDQTDPVIECPDGTGLSFTLVADSDCNAVLPDYTVETSATDNCSESSGITITQIPVGGTVLSGHGTSQEVTMRAEDVSGRISECTFTVTVEDQTDPVIECPDGTGLSFTLVADSDCNALLPDYTVETSATDNCSASSGITITQIPVGGTVLSGHGTSQEVTMRAEDASGRISECTFIVTVEDQTDPVIECPDGTGLSFTLVADSDCNAVLPDYTVETSATDNCSTSSGITITQIPIGGTVLSGHGTSQEVTMRAEDASGRISECTFIVTVEDQTDPVIECPDGTGLSFTLVADSDCNAVLPDYTVETSATDNCSASSGITITQIPVGGTVLSGHGTSQEVTMRAEDGSGRISECTFIVTVEDQTDPVIECPDGIGLSFTLVADSDCNAVLPDYTVETSATDNCSESSGITITQIPIGGTVLSGHGTSQEVTMRAEDASGRISECTFIVTVEDQTDPVIECPDGTGLSFTLVADSDCNAVLPDYTVETSATDNCSASSGITITQIPVGGTVLSGHGTSQEVTMRAEDASGRISECTFTVTVEDQTDPVIECPDAIDVSVWWTDVSSGSISRASVDGTSQVEIISGQTDPSSVIANKADNKIYWIDRGTSQIRKADFNGNHIETIVSGLTNPLSIVLDNESSKIYWTESTSIGRADLDGSNVEILISNIVDPFDLALDRTNHKIYWTESSMVQKADLDGSNQAVILSVQNTNFENLELDIDNDKMYLTVAGSSGKIQRAELNGSNLVDLVGSINNPGGLHLDLIQDKLYFVEVGNHKIRRVDLDGTDLETAADLSSNSVISGIFLEDPTPLQLIAESGCVVTIPDFSKYIVIYDNCTNSEFITVVQNPPEGTVISADATMQTIEISAQDGNTNLSFCDFTIAILDPVGACDICEGDDSFGDADQDGFCADLDCDDNDPSVFPGAEELCDGKDNNCDGILGSTEFDNDGDGLINCLDNCSEIGNQSQQDSDCDRVGDACDMCPGGDDMIDNDFDGLPDCAFPPDYDDIDPAWKCAPNKILICHGGSAICANKNAIPGHINHGDFIGPCSGASCTGLPAFSAGKHRLENLLVYPNPSVDEITVEFRPEEIGDINISLYSSTGHLVFRPSTINVEEVQIHRYQLGLQNLPGGMYFIHLLSPTGVIRSKSFIKIE